MGATAHLRDTFDGEVATVMIWGASVDTTAMAKYQAARFATVE